MNTIHRTSSALRPRSTVRPFSSQPPKDDASSSSSNAAPSAPSPPPRGALSGVRILDLSRILAGPYCTQILGDFGAEVWKIENPIGGDDTRFWGPPFVKLKETPVIASSLSTANAYCSIGESSYFLSANRNKHSVAINFKSPQGAKIVQDLARHADVLVENFTPGKLAEFGLDYDTLRAINPSLIYASLTGFGTVGPLAQSAGYDLMASARGGLMHITGGVSEPSKVGVAITDLSTGLVLHGAILAALFAREKDPQRRGQKIDTNLLEVQVASLANIGQNFHCDPRMTGVRRPQSAHESIVPYQSFACKPIVEGGKDYAIVGALNNKQWRNLIRAMHELNDTLPGTTGEEKQDLSFLEEAKYKQNADRVKHRSELIPLLQRFFLLFPKSTLLSCLSRHDIPSAPINNIAEVFAEEQVRATGIVKNVRHRGVGEMKVRRECTGEERL
jgi:succinate--hydroxymethylglutarate CoA-transferase